VFKLDPHGRLRITVPLPVAARFGLPKPHARAAGGVLTLAAPVRFAHHGAELAARVTNRLGVRFDLEPVYAGGRVVKLYLRACWTREDVPPVPSLEAARAGGVVAVDLNADHLAAARLDSSGNPVGAPVVIPLVQEGPASLRDARLRTAITALLDFTRASGAGTLVVKDLNFTDPAIRERTGRGRRAKTFRRTVAGILTGALRTRLARMAARQGVTVVAVDPRYTSKHGGSAWRRQLTRRTARPAVPAVTPTATGVPVATPSRFASRHCGAAVAIGRRGLGLRLTTRPARTPPEGWKPPHVTWGWCGQPDQARQARVHVGAPPGHADRTCAPTTR
jgi:hypothetical protein